MLSGVGPEEEITKHGIRMVHSLPGIGRNLQEHVFNRSVLQIHDGLNDLPKFAEPTAHDAAQTEFIEKGTGQYDTAYHAMSFTLIKISEELLDSAEFKALPPDAQAHIKKRGVPVTEVITHSELPSPPFDPTKTYLPVAMVPMATQSRGTVTLASADPYAAPVCDPKVLTHPFDLLNYKLSMRQLMRVLTSEPFAKFTTGKPLFPASESDEDIMAHCAQTLLVAWHMSCTAKMGKRDDEMACVDTSFRVHGLEGLRVADMSVIPFVFNTHLVAVAYTVGETAAERFIEEYGLED